MCSADTVAETNGTHIANCYCGWTDHGHATASTAESAQQRWRVVRPDGGLTPVTSESDAVIALITGP